MSEDVSPTAQKIMDAIVSGPLPRSVTANEMLELSDHERLVLAKAARKYGLSVMMWDMSTGEVQIRGTRKRQAIPV